MSVLRYASPTRWKKFAEGQLELLRRRRADDALDAEWAKAGPLALRRSEALLVADGLWFNPGYFLRLRLFVEAMARRERFSLLGILRRRSSWRERRALERIGFSEFVYLEDDPEFPVAAFREQADALLSRAAMHADLLALELPEGVPASIWYDAVLHRCRHGRPPVSDPEWRASLAETLAFIHIYRRLLEQRPVRHIGLSHAWNSEWGTLTWLALKRQIPVHCISQVSEAIRIHRLRTTADYVRPIEHLPFDVYARLPAAVQRALAELGHRELQRRHTSQTSDINIRFAYAPETRATDRGAARRVLAPDSNKPIGVIYGHSWFDYPHLFGMQNFDDFADWFAKTLEAIRHMEHVTWLLKPHPMEIWYGGQKMQEMIRGLPDHVRVLPHKIDTLTVMNGADAVITVHGTAGIEAAANGTPVISADRSYYEDWGISHVARTSAQYVDLLARVGTLAVPDTASRDRAAACFACAYGEPHDEAGALRVPCDSRGSLLFHEVRAIVEDRAGDLTREVDRLCEFLAQDGFDSFQAWSFVRAAERRAAVARVA